jgi:hypothetical protein
VDVAVAVGVAVALVTFTLTDCDAIPFATTTRVLDPSSTSAGTWMIKVRDAESADEIASLAGDSEHHSWNLEPAHRIGIQLADRVEKLFDVHESHPHSRAGSDCQLGGASPDALPSLPEQRENCVQQMDCAQKLTVLQVSGGPEQQRAGEGVASLVHMSAT